MMKDKVRVKQEKGRETDTPTCGGGGGERPSRTCLQWLLTFLLSFVRRGAEKVFRGGGGRGGRGNRRQSKE